MAGPIARSAEDLELLLGVLADADGPVVAGWKPVLPATAAPIGRSPGRLPVGMQIIGPYFEDRSCIEFAKLLAGVAGGFKVPPGFA